MLLREVSDPKGSMWERWDTARSSFGSARMCLRWGMEVSNLKDAIACFRAAQKNPPERLAHIFEGISNLSNMCYCICEHIIHLHMLKFIRRPKMAAFLEWFAEVFDTITSATACISLYLASRATNSEIPKLEFADNLFSIPTWIYFIAEAHMRRPIPSARTAALCSVIAGLLRMVALRKATKNNDEALKMKMSMSMEETTEAKKGG